MTAPALALPEGAELTPPGYCHACGTAPGESLRVLHDLPSVRGVLGCGKSIPEPVDPTEIVSSAAYRAAREIWGGQIPDAIRPRLAWMLGWV